MHPSLLPGALALPSRKRHCQKHWNNSRSKFASLETQFLGCLKEKLFAKATRFFLLLQEDIYKNLTFVQMVKIPFNYINFLKSFIATIAL